MNTEHKVSKQLINLCKSCCSYFSTKTDISFFFLIFRQKSHPKRAIFTSLFVRNRVNVVRLFYYFYFIGVNGYDLVNQTKDNRVKGILLLVLFEDKRVDGVHLILHLNTIEVNEDHLKAQ